MAVLTYKDVHDKMRDIGSVGSLLLIYFKLINFKPRLSPFTCLLLTLNLSFPLVLPPLLPC